MPKRPPKEWMRHCIQGVKSKSPNVDDPGAVCADLWHHKMSDAAKRKVLKSEAEEPIKIGDQVAVSAKHLRNTGQYTGDIGAAKGKVTKIDDYGEVAIAHVDWDTPEVSKKINVKNLVRVGSPRYSYESMGFDDKDVQQVIKERKMENEKKQPNLEDPMGTGKIMKAIADHWNYVHRESAKRMIGRDEYWGGLVKYVKENAGISELDLVHSGLPVNVVVGVIGEDEPKEDVGSSIYRSMCLKQAEDKETVVDLKQVSEKLAPHCKNFKTPIEALMKGNAETILSVLKHVFGEDVEDWYIPAEPAGLFSRQLSNLLLGEAFHVAKFETTSQIFECEDGELKVKEDAAARMSDAFDKRSTEYLLNLFPNANPGYVRVLINEVKTVLNLKSKEEMDRLFPNINPTYLVNLKESQRQAIADAFGGGGLLAYFNQQLHDEDDEDDEDEDKDK